MSKSRKMLVMELADGSKWAIAAEVIADNRATYYAEDGYKEEFDYTMTDTGELADWAANNMNWSDVEKYAIPYKPAPKPDMQAEWCDGGKEVIDTPTHLDLPMPPEIAEKLK